MPVHECQIIPLITLFIRRPRSVHGRIQHIELTSKGRKLLAQCRERVQALELETVENLSMDEQGCNGRSPHRIHDPMRAFCVHIFAHNVNFDHAIKADGMINGILRIIYSG